MGWAGGSGLAADIWDTVREYIPEEARKKVARKIVDLFENEDCDTMPEAELLWKDSRKRLR
jgi:hypothetical protein